MFLFDQVFFPHALDSIVLLILFVLTQHHLAEGSPAQHFQQFKLLEVSYIVLVSFTFENNLALSLYLLVLLDAFRIQHQRLDGMQLFVVFAHVVYRCRVRLKGKVVVIVKRHLCLVESISPKCYLQ